MPKYYCDYCKSYLTHDTMSVRRSHLMGKTHIRLYCDYYEAKAKETGIWNPDDIDYEIKLGYLSAGAPGSEKTSRDQRDRENEALGSIWEETEEGVRLPPPPTLTGLPNPPPSVLRSTEEYQKAIWVHQKKEEVEQI